MGGGGGRSYVVMRICVCAKVKEKKMKSFPGRQTISNPSRHIHVLVDAMVDGDL